MRKVRVPPAGQARGANITCHMASFQALRLGPAVPPKKSYCFLLSFLGLEFHSLPPRSFFSDTQHLHPTTTAVMMNTPCAPDSKENGLFSSFADFLRRSRKHFRVLSVPPSPGQA